MQFVRVGWLPPLLELVALNQDGDLDLIKTNQSANGN